MSDDCQAPFRQGFCRAPCCGDIFFVCPRCDQEQVYCSNFCRKLARRVQHRVANRRHQQSEEGRLDHRDRQRAYRRRKALASSQSATTKSVTDHTPSPTASCLTLLAAASAPAPKPSWTTRAPFRPQEWCAFGEAACIKYAQELKKSSQSTVGRGNWFADGSQLYHNSGSRHTIKSSMEKSPDVVMLYSSPVLDHRSR